MVWSSQTRPFHVLALPIFPGRLQPSIVGRSELNFRVRDGNGWTLALINTNYFNQLSPAKITMKLYRLYCSLSRGTSARLCFSFPAFKPQVWKLERKSNEGNELSALAGSERSEACF